MEEEDEDETEMFKMFTDVKDALNPLNMIEKVAKQCADTMQGNGGLDEKALMSSMSGLFGGLLKNK